MIVRMIATTPSERAFSLAGLMRQALRRRRAPRCAIAWRATARRQAGASPYATGKPECDIAHISAHRHLGRGRMGKSVPGNLADEAGAAFRRIPIVVGEVMEGRLCKRPAAMLRSFER